MNRGRHTSPPCPPSPGLRPERVVDPSGGTPHNTLPSLTVTPWQITAAERGGYAAGFDAAALIPFWVRFLGEGPDEVGDFPVVRYDSRSPQGSESTVPARYLMGRVDPREIERARQSDWTLGFHAEDAWSWCLLCGAVAARAPFETIMRWLREGGILCAECGWTTIGIVPIPETEGSRTQGSRTQTRAQEGKP